ncbi:hypothetical protein [Deinococcus roseus]|uniref:Uncharacterized protein n=1 Tax=Deinococcus roseus TaxID=392414 RepID=A0ABQ2CUE6_9DEIO|nr:hypothetical protein [Deinococcus roseus]GGJ21670.1 hypothetical protein GCM10008938_04840 [Deinococcus roseus]
MHQHIVKISAALALLGALGTGYAQSTPSKPTHKCGNYSVIIQPVSGEEFHEEKLTLKGPKGTVFSRTDWSMEVAWCKDVTGDGVPEVDLRSFSGGAHCCFTHDLYSLTTPPRKLAHIETAHSDALDPRQLDGKGPLELVTADWRFAYGFGMSFAESVALPEVYSYVNGHYAVNTRAFPGLIGGWFTDIDKLEDTYSVLARVSELILLGKESQIAGVLQKAPDELRRWIEGYLPDIKDSLSTLGYNEYGVLAGLAPEDITYTSVVGGFTTAGSKQVLTLVKGNAKNAHVKSGQLGVLLIDKTASGFKVTATGLTFPSKGKDQDYTFNLQHAVRRSNGLSDVVVGNGSSGSLKLQAYRMSKNTLILVKDDALDTALKFLQDLYNLAEVNGKVFDKDAKRTPEQWAALMDRARVAREQGKNWTPLLGIEPEQLGDFNWYSMQFLQDTPQQAQLYLTVDYGKLPEDGGDYGIFGPRYGLTLTLQKDQTWKPVSVDLTRLPATPYDGDQ